MAVRPRDEDVADGTLVLRHVSVHTILSSWALEGVGSSLDSCRHQLAGSVKLSAAD